jgi:class 3 adenylate cyclase/tetratricopeptide (TPR) repeat protein
VHCAVCGELNAAHHRHCWQCGARLAQASPGAREDGRSPASSGAAERRQVSVMFCDIVDSTPLAAALGADAMHRLVGAFFDRSRAIVQAHDGVIGQFLGDGFMALFGAPLARPDHAVAAARAALAIQADATAHARAGLPAGRTLRLRIGLHCGSVVFGQVGAGAGSAATVIGDAVNLAARLQAEAEPGAVVCSDALRRAAAGGLRTIALGERRLKGVHDAVHVHRVVAIERTAGASPERLFGRQAEIAVVEAFLATLARGRGALLAIEGEAGIGKSALAEVALARARERGWSCGAGAHATTGPLAALAPLKDAIAQALRVERRLSVAVRARARVGALLGTADTTLLAHAHALIGLPLTEQESAGRDAQDGVARSLGMRLAAHRLAGALAARSPCLLLQDDWQAADPASVEMLLHVLPLARDAPLGLVLCARPDAESLARAATTAQGAGVALHRLSLPPLDVAAAHGLLAQRAPGLAGAQAARIVERAAGNPLYLGELLRARAAASPHVNGRDSGLPPSVEGMVLARIDRLAPADREALRAAAVLGRSFGTATILHMLGADGEACLRRLAEEGLLRVDDAAGEPGWRFVHPLICEVAYAGLLEEQRRRWHARAAEAIDALGDAAPAERASLLAHHRAGAGDWTRALPQLRRAAGDAGMLAADAVVIDLHRRTLAVAEAAGQALARDERAEIELGLAESLFRLGRHEEARDTAVAALAALGIAMPARRGLLRTAALARLLALQLGAGAGRHGRRPHAALAARALELIANIDYYRDPPRFAHGILAMLDHAPPGSRGEVVGMASVGAIADHLGWDTLAARWHGRAAAAAARNGEPVALGYADNLAGLHHYAHGRWPAAIERLEAALGHFERAAHPRLTASALGSLYLVLRSRGDPRWLTLAERQEELARTTGDAQALAWATNAAGVAIQYRGAMTGARERFEAASARYAAIPDNRFLAGALARGAHCLAWEGDFGVMHDLLAKVDTILRTHAMRGLLASAPLTASAEARVLHALTERTRGDGAPARFAAAAVRRVLAHGRRTGDESGIDAHRLAGQLLWHRRREREALSHWRRGAALGAAVGARRALALLRHTWGECADDQAQRALAARDFAASGSAPPPRSAVSSQ